MLFSIELNWRKGKRGKILCQWRKWEGTMNCLIDKQLYRFVVSCWKFRSRVPTTNFSNFICPQSRSPFSVYQPIKLVQKIYVFFLCCDLNLPPTPCSFRLYHHPLTQNKPVYPAVKTHLSQPCSRRCWAAGSPVVCVADCTLHLSCEADKRS